MIVELLLVGALAHNPPGMLAPLPQQVVRPGGPPRDSATSDAKGTSRIRGRVTNAGGRPLRRVEIRLSGSALDGARTANTDAQGRFEIADLPAGRYFVTASRAGYLRTAYGETYPGQPADPIEISNGVAVDHIDIALHRTAVISGNVFDEAGEPAAGAVALAMQVRFSNRKSRLMPVSRAISDDLGQFRLGGLAPGNYYVEVLSRDKWEGDPPEKKKRGFLPTFYPSVPSVGEAQLVRLKTGQQVSGIDVSLIAGELVNISGTAVNSQGLPIGGETVAVNQVVLGDNFASYTTAGSAKTAADGSFVVRDVPPGSYTLSVQTGPATGPPEVAQVSVTAMDNVESVQLMTFPGSTVSGRVVLDANSTLPSRFQLTDLRVSPRPVDDVARMNISGFMVKGGAISDDGSFTVDSVSSRIRLTVTPLPPGWAVKRVDYNGEDITTSGAHPAGKAVDGVVVTLTDKFPTIHGTVRDDKGNPAPETAAIVFPEDPALWDSLLNAVQIGRADKGGVFAFRALTPGSYLVVAVPAPASASALMDPSVLDSLRVRATRVTVAEGDTKRVDLVVVPIPH
jgi:hypothetical protein